MLCVAFVYHVFWVFSMMFVLLLIFANKEKKPIIKLSYFLTKFHKHLIKHVGGVVMTKCMVNCLKISKSKKA
jgi:uncharacterized integral membrane protein